GLSYVCSDCGSWPGGQVNLTWKQWRAFTSGIYLSVAKPGSLADRALSRLLGSKVPIRLAARGQVPRGLQQELTLLSALRGHVALWLPTGITVCGMKPGALR